MHSAVYNLNKQTKSESGQYWLVSKLWYKRGGRQDGSRVNNKVMSTLYASYNRVRFQLEYTHARTQTREKRATRSKDENAVESEAGGVGKSSCTIPKKTQRGKTIRLKPKRK